VILTEINSARIAYQLSEGDGDVVVLAGGSGMPPVVWDLCGLVGRLEGAGYRVLTYAARGVAPSDATPPPYSIDQLADDVVGILDHLEISNCRLVGYSLGGEVAEFLARTRPDLIRAAMLLASSGPLSPVFRAALEAGMDLIDKYGALPDSYGRWEELMTSLPPKMLRDPEQVAGWWELLGAHPDAWASPAGAVGQWAAETSWMHDPARAANLTSISIPVQVACFEYDLLFPPAGGREAAAAMPLGTFSGIRDAAHGGLITHPEESCDAVVDFLARSEGAL
jgi:pimeloyl-ACP methyl ester carboxylesterase